jgi:hypothetical protein
MGRFALMAWAGIEITCMSGEGQAAENENAGDVE